MLVTLIPLAGLVAFATMWAGAHRSEAANANRARVKIDLLVETSQLYQQVHMIAISAGLVRAAGGSDALGTLSAFPAAGVEAGYVAVRARRAELEQRAHAGDAEARAIALQAVEISDRFTSSVTRNGRPDGELDTEALFTADGARAARVAASALERQVGLLRNDVRNTSYAADAVVLAELSELQQTLTYEAAYSMARFFDPRLASDRTVQAAITRNAIQERVALAAMLPADRPMLRAAGSPGEWAALRGQLIRGRDASLLRAVVLVRGRVMGITQIQNTIATRLQASAAADASRAESSFRWAVLLAFGLATISLGMGLLLLRHTTHVLRRLAGEARKIGQGDLSVRPELIAGRDETAVLAQAFHEMSATLSALQTQVDALADGDGCTEDVVVPGAIGQSIARSVTRLSRITGRLRTSEQVARLTVDTAIEAIWTLDNAGCIVSANPPAVRMMGQPEFAVVGQRLTHRVGWEGIAIPSDGMPPEGTEVEATINPLHGPPVNGLVTVRHVTGPDGEHRAMVFVRDVTDRRRLERQLEWDATHDPLTQLPNRLGLRATLESLATVDGDPVAVLFIDLDRFKQVNDALGHQPGDELLRQVAGRLRSMAGDGDHVARLGGDEFVVVHSHVTDDDDIEALARRIIAVFEQPFDLNGSQAHVSASVGIVVASASTDPSDLIRHADLAMYNAKKAGPGRIRRYDASMQADLQARLVMEDRLRTALEHGDLEAWFQPILSMDGSTVADLELLARWFPEGQQPVSPAEFIPVAEESGLIADIGRWALRRAAEAAVDFRRHDPDFDATIAVNVSGLHLVHGDLVGDLRAMLEATGARGEWLRIEITESYLIEESDPFVDDTLAAIRRLGVRLSVDDFGTGHSSLTYLRRIPADIVKVDRSYVQALESDPNEVAIIGLVAAMAHGLGMRVVAEGIETATQQRLLTSVGCDLAQGFMFARPMPAAQVVEWLDAREDASSRPRSIPT